MWMTETQMSDFPLFAAYVRESMPTCKTKASILENLEKYASLTDAEAKHALTWGTAPLVAVVDLWDDTAWKPIANGRFDMTKPFEIQIAKHRVDQFEIGGGIEKGKWGNVLVVGATIFHEICHWGNFWHGVTERRDAGKRFEKAVYGRDIG